MDFVEANGGTDDLWIYLGNGDGTFQLPRIIPLTKGLTPVYLATADLRGNGILDLVVAEFDTSTVGVLLGNGDGTFGYEQDYVLPQAPSSVVVDDFNRDGKLDIAAVMVTVNEPEQLAVQYLATLIGDGTGSFAAPLISMNPGFYSSANTIAAGDVNGDGFPDVLITGPGLENSQVYLNNGDGTFTPGAVVVQNSFADGIPPLLLAGTLGDVNGDGCLDVLDADGYGMTWISLGDCSGNFGAPSYVLMGDSNASIALADMNGDGHPDIVTTTISLLDPIYGEVAGNMMAVALGDGNGNFNPARDYVGTGMSYSLAIADFNGDGHPDVVSASPDTDTATVYINDGSAGFGFPQGEWIGLPGVGVLNAPLSAPSFADLNGDGKPDVLLLDEGYNGEYFITTMLNDGTGHFASPLASDAGVAITSNWMGDYRLGDFRNTGHLDFVGIGLGLNYTTGTQYILFVPGNGDGTFGKSTLIATSGADGAMAVGDFNRDGKLDFAAVGANPNGAGWVLTIFLGNGDGTFRTGGSYSFTDSAANTARVFVGDFNRDGKLDISIYDTSNGYWTTASYIWEFLGNGDGTFQSGKQLFSAFQPMTMADVNGDSWLDIVRYDFMWPDGTTETLGPAKFTTYLDQPSGSFAQSSSYAPYGGIPLQAPPFLQFGDPTTSSMVADLNGDGKPDEIAFQEPPPTGGDDYAQILLGNGDGTFTPTYDVFDFQKVFGFPAYAHIFDGSNFSDLLEIDGATSSMHVFKGGPAPSLQLALEESQVIGNSGCGWVFLNVPSSSDTTITISSSVPGVVLPASVTVPAGALSRQFCYTLSTTYDWHQVFDIRAQLGSDISVAYASQSYVVGFSESISPSADQAIFPGQSTTPITVSLTSSQNYSSTVQLSCVALLVGETCTFGQNTLDVSPTQVASTTVVVNSSASTQGTGAVIITASDGNVTTRQAFNVSVVPLFVSALGSNLVQSTSPGSGTGQVTISGIPPYTPSCSGLPQGVTCSFSGNQLPYPSVTTLALSVNVPAGVTAANYPFSVEIVSSSVQGSSPFTLSVGDFSLQPPASGSAWAPPGGTETVNMTAKSINFNSAINVSCTLPTGTCTGGTFPVSSNGSTINLTVSEPSNASPGAETLTVTGTYGSINHAISFPFYIADYSGTLSTSTLTIPRGGSGAVSATVSATTGFGGNVTFACSGSSQLSCSFSPSSVQPTASSPQTTKITITASDTAQLLPVSRGDRIILLALILPFGLILGKGSKSRSRRVTSALILLGFALGLILPSCGGGGNQGGGGGSSSYTITVSATDTASNTTRTLGTVNVTVTH